MCLCVSTCAFQAIKLLHCSIEKERRESIVDWANVSPHMVVEIATSFDSARFSSSNKGAYESIPLRAVRVASQIYFTIQNLSVKMIRTKNDQLLISYQLNSLNSLRMPLLWPGVYVDTLWPAQAKSRPLQPIPIFCSLTLLVKPF